jgi:hypothetical protein
MAATTESECGSAHLSQERLSGINEFEHGLLALLKGTYASLEDLARKDFGV